MLPIHTSKVSVFNYDDIPPGYYHQVMLSGHPVQKFWHKEKFRRVSHLIGDNDHVLDLGCGPGSFLSILGSEKPGVTAIGVDVASKQIDFANNNIAPQFSDNRIGFSKLLPPDMCIPFPDKTFDVITSIEVIEHIHPYFSLRMIEEAKRVLKPDGKIIVTTPNYRSFWPFIEFILEKASPVKYHEQHINKYTPNSLNKFLESGGLSVNSLDSFFIISPFLAVLSNRIARACHKIEQKIGKRVGSLLVAEAKKIDFQNLQ